MPIKASGELAHPDMSSLLESVGSGTSSGLCKHWLLITVVHPHRLRRSWHSEYSHRRRTTSWHSEIAHRA
eukprot:2053330-Amphidinium_carterae.1